MCGAFTGGVMALGLALGRHSPEESVDHTYEAVREFKQRFEARFGSINCQELTGVHLGTPEGQLAFKEKGQIKSCTDYVGYATQLVVDIINR
jgi:C_GCAxxG_C_C family probable redox protein